MKQSKRDKQPEASVEEPKEQPAQEQAPGEVDLMDFLEDAAPLKIVPIPDWGGKDEDDPGNAQDYAVVGASDPRYATGGVIEGDAQAVTAHQNCEIAEAYGIDLANLPPLPEGSSDVQSPRTFDFPAGTLIDTADVVLHGPTGEKWVVAYVKGEHLSWCGWPEGEARLSDCTLIEKASPQERRKALEQLAAMCVPDARQRYAQRRLEEEQQVTVTDCNAKSLPIELKEAIADAVRKMPPERVTQIVKEEAEKALDAARMETVETLHAPHGIKADYVQNPLLPKGATVTPKRMATSGCGHGHANAILCPECRANRKP